MLICLKNNAVHVWLNVTSSLKREIINIAHEGNKQQKHKHTQIAKISKKKKKKSTQLLISLLLFD